MQYSLSGIRTKYSLKENGKEVPIEFPNIENNLGKVSSELFLSLIKKYTINFYVDGIDQVISNLPLNRIGTFLIPALDHKTLVYETKMRSGSRVCVIRSPITIKNQCKIFAFIILFIFYFFLKAGFPLNLILKDNVSKTKKKDFVNKNFSFLLIHFKNLFF
jgi:hypothetical protein